MDFIQIGSFQWTVAIGIAGFCWLFIKFWGGYKFVEKKDFELHKTNITNELNAITTAANTHKEQSFKDNSELKLKMAEMKGQMDLVGNNLGHLLENVKDIKTSAAETRAEVMKSIVHIENNQRHFVDFATKNLIKKDDEK